MPGFIESHFSRRDKAVLWLANVVFMHHPFGYHDHPLYWWFASRSYAWSEIQNERRWAKE